MTRLTKRLMTGLLLLALSVTMLPVLGQQAYAAGDWTKVSSLEYSRSKDADCAINKVM